MARNIYGSASATIMATTISAPPTAWRADMDSFSQTTLSTAATTGSRLNSTAASVGPKARLRGRLSPECENRGPERQIERRGRHRPVRQRREGILKSIRRRQKGGGPHRHDTADHHLRARQQPRLGAAGEGAHHHDVDAAQDGAQQDLNVAAVHFSEHAPGGVARPPAARQMNQQVHSIDGDQRAQRRGQLHSLADGDGNQRRKQYVEAGDEAGLGGGGEAHAVGL